MSRLPELLAKEQSLEVATGRRGSSLYAPHGAKVLAALIHRQASGLFHVVNRGEVDWIRFARECQRQMREAGLSMNSCHLKEVPLGQFGSLQARRPDYSVLSTAKLEGLLNEEMPSWEEALSDYLKLWHSRCMEG